MSARIEQYAMIGDCETAALVSHRGSIDWLCWPHFASPACFAALLGTEENGCWSIAPENPVAGKRRYLDHTLVLETLFETPDGLVSLVDFMPVRQRNSRLVRIVRGLSGTVLMKMKLALRFDYGRTEPWVTRIEDGALRALPAPTWWYCIPVNSTMERTCRPSASSR
jgi:GH15 family glucan-1,4-alpha-glucosidase